MDTPDAFLLLPWPRGFVSSPKAIKSSPCAVCGVKACEGESAIMPKACACKGGKRARLQGQGRERAGGSALLQARACCI